jgi:hypothetical protein
MDMICPQDILADFGIFGVCNETPAMPEQPRPV